MITYVSRITYVPRAHEWRNLLNMKYSNISDITPSCPTLDDGFIRTCLPAQIPLLFICLSTRPAQSTVPLLFKCLSICPEWSLSWLSLSSALSSAQVTPLNSQWDVHKGFFDCITPTCMCWYFNIAKLLLQYISQFSYLMCMYLYLFSCFSVEMLQCFNDSFIVNCSAPLEETCLTANINAKGVFRVCCPLHYYASRQIKWCR